MGLEQDVRVRACGTTQAKNGVHFCEHDKEATRHIKFTKFQSHCGRWLVTSATNIDRGGPSRRSMSLIRLRSFAVMLLSDRSAQMESISFTQ